jgi:hypothetical protein
MSRSLASNRRLRVAACLIAALATGCGGGGGEDIPPPPELLQITTGNQLAVARATASIFVGLGGLSDVGIIGSSAGPRASAAAGATKQALGRAVQAARAGDARMRPLATYTVTDGCPAGGSISITIDDRDNNGLPSAGDLMTMTFSDCRESASTLVSGGVSVDISSASETQLSGLFTFAQLAVVDGDNSFTTNGQANATYSETTDPAGTLTARTTMSVTAAGFITAISVPGYGDTFTNDPNFSATWIDVMPMNGPGYTTSALMGKVHAASLGGRIILDTNPPVHVWSTESYPDSGVVLVTGLQSKLRMTVLSTTTARLELDSNNDGTYEATRDVPWSELLPF